MCLNITTNVIVLAVVCPKLSTPKNGKFQFVGPVPSYLTFSIAEYSCDDDYHIDDEEYVLICLSDGSWSNKPPQCLQSDCASDGKFEV